MLCTAFHCDDKRSLPTPFASVAGGGGGVEQVGGIASSYSEAEDTEGDDHDDNFVMTFFVALQLSYLVVGNRSSKTFAHKIKECGKDVRHEFQEDELELFALHPGSLYMFSGAFPHAGYNYRELNVREFFRVYTDGRPGSVDDQHYFEERKLRK